MPNTQPKKSCSQANKHAWLLSTILWLSYTVDLIEFWTFFFLSLDSQWVWHHVPCLDILGRRSCCLANLPHWTGKMGSNERWDWKVSFVGLILVNVKWNSYPDFSLSPRHFAARSLFSWGRISRKASGSRVWNSWHLPINEFSSKHLSTPLEFLSLLTTNNENSNYPLQCQ